MQLSQILHAVGRRKGVPVLFVLLIATLAAALFSPAALERRIASLLPTNWLATMSSRPIMENELSTRLLVVNHDREVLNNALHSVRLSALLATARTSPDTRTLEIKPLPKWLWVEHRALILAVYQIGDDEPLVWTRLPCVLGGAGCEGSLTASHHRGPVAVSARQGAVFELRIHDMANGASPEIQNTLPISSLPIIASRRFVAD